MAYDAQETRLIVHALALTGSVAGADRWLMEHSLLPSISIKTLRKFWKKPEIAERIAKEAAAIKESEHKAACAAARRHVRGGFRGFSKEISGMQLLGRQTLEGLNIDLLNNDLNTKQKIDLWAKIMNMVIKTRT